MSRRSERVAEAIRREASLLIEYELRDPRIGFITITRATITEDLRSAVIYYSVLGEEKTKKLAQKGFTSASPFIKKQIARRLKLRYAPDIKFKIDDTLDYAGRIEDMLRKIKEEKKEK
ncbi:MAG: 30S ribosome-binding factor RbfA [Candidatus Omnitrophica bacterium]|nr:30S ribosome-binding factor RbfA [Candidatus Omnitrophota bacterium]